MWVARVQTNFFEIFLFIYFCTVCIRNSFEIHPRSLDINQNVAQPISIIGSVVCFSVFPDICDLISIVIAYFTPQRANNNSKAYKFQIQYLE